MGLYVCLRSCYAFSNYIIFFFFSTAIGVNSVGVQLEMATILGSCFERYEEIMLRYYGNEQRLYVFLSFTPLLLFLTHTQTLSKSERVSEEWPAVVTEKMEDRLDARQWLLLDCLYRQSR